MTTLRLSLLITLIAIGLFYGKDVAASNRCEGTVQGRIAWDGQKNRNWSQEQLDRLCRGAEDSSEPGYCYRLAMSGAVKHGDGKKWSPDEALALCAGATKSKQRIACVESKLARGTSVSDAINSCGDNVAEPESARPSSTSNMVAKPPVAVVDRSVQRPQDNSLPVQMSCKGPFKFTLNRVPERNRPMIFDVSFDFIGATSAQINSGECWRQGGWDFGPSLSDQREGRMIYRVNMETCPFIDKLVIENGRITDYGVNETFLGSIWFDDAVRASGRSFVVDATWLGAQSHSQPVVYAAVTPPGTTVIRPQCNR